MSSEEIKDTQELNPTLEVEKNSYFCWLCGEATAGAEVCPSCGAQQ